MPTINTKKRNALRKIVDYTSGSIVAGLLMMWGTMNLVTNVTDLIEGAPDRSWWLAALFSILVVLLPFGLGLWLIVRLMKPGRA